MVGFQKMRGPRPMQLVVVMAVRKAVSAATRTFTAISMIRFFIILHSSLFTRLGVGIIIIVLTFTGVDNQCTCLTRHSEATAIYAIVLSQLNL